MAQVGVLGGTFNPPHLGHLVCAVAAIEQLALDRVVLVPASVPPHKAVPEDPGIEVRVELCRLACVGDARLSVSAMEAEREGPSYTVDTLRAMRADAPDDEVTFLLGADMAMSFRRWREPEGILSLARLGIVEREGVGRADILSELEPLAGAAERVRFFEMPRIDISSSMLRGRAADGRSLRWLVPDAVADHVAVRGLYRVGPNA